MNTNLSGRVRNTPLPLANALLPLYEAVVNSIHAIDDRGLSTNDGEIRIEILRKQREAELDFQDGKKKRGPDSLEEIVGFKIADNGIGFTDENMKSFETLDSEHKATRGGRGIGRLLWLKAFKRVRVESVFVDASGLLTNRTFIFDSQAGVRDEQLESSPSSPRKTEIQLLEFSSSYREHSRKSTKAISDSILEHCLWYFIRAGSAPLMTVSDQDETISLQDSFEEHMHSSAIRESITVKQQPFDLIHIKLRSNLLSAHSIALCADNRVVTEEKLAGRIPGLHGKLSDAQGEFIYSCYVCSPYLDRFARPERTSFEIPETIDGFFKDTEISLQDIREAVAERTKEQLTDHIASNMKRAKERVDAFVAYKAPRYRPILPRIPRKPAEYRS